MTATWKRSKGERGFTLLEVMIALAVIAVSLVVLIQAVSASVVRSRYAAQLVRASFAAERIMTETERAGLPPGEGEGEEEIGGERFPWRRRVEPSPVDGLVKVTVTVRWGGGERMSHTPSRPIGPAEMKGPAKLAAERGFTLLEVLVAVTILALLMGAVYSTFSAVTASDRQVEAAVDITLEGENLLALITEDLSSALSPEPRRGGEGALPFYGFYCRAVDGLPRLDFARTYSPSGDARDLRLQEIGYSLDPLGEGEGYRLLRRIDETPDDDVTAGGEAFLLTARLAALSISFARDGGEWSDQWTGEEGGLPAFVQVELTLAGDGGGRETFSTAIPIPAGRSL